MSHLRIEVNDAIAVIAIERGKVNAMNSEVVNELSMAFRALEVDEAVTAIILTGRNKFFSFGFDIPEFVEYSKERFTDFVVNFTNLYSYLFVYPKPVIAALNGHAVAGGCMLALACDHRLMVSGRAKISLNEIGFGSSVFAGATEMLRFQIGSRGASEVLYSGAMYEADEAKRMGLIDSVVEEARLMEDSFEAARLLAAKHAPAFRSIKRLLRGQIAERFQAIELSSIKEFVDIWYSEETWQNLLKVQIR
jgi:Delta3-Delta2-enoyl-CoA isomerase